MNGSATLDSFDTAWAWSRVIQNLEDEGILAQHAKEYRPLLIQSFIDAMRTTAIKWLSCYGCHLHHRT